MSLSVDDGIQISDFARFDYGFSLDSVAFFDRLNYASPYARLTQELGHEDSVVFSFASGMPHFRGEGGLQDDLRSLSVFPRVSRLGDRARVQRAENYEIAYKRRVGHTSVQIAAFRESVANAALLLGGPGRLADSPDLLPDLFSNSAVFNGGDYQSSGYAASVAHEFADWMTLTLMYATGGALVASRDASVVGSPDDLRSMIRQGRRQTVTSQVAGRSPYTGTHFVASYQWASRRAATPGHLFATHSVRGDVGLNFFLRQPLPSPSAFPVRVEATADLRNAFGEGYIPVQNRDGSRLVLMNTPRSLRGGLSFIF
ncbi:MAG: hypothetical protein IPM24_12445 [Bryobacterales bacterium]|nr:hypothetical protein [Bryobacterales bacterium]